MAQNNEMRITLKTDKNLNSIHQQKAAVTFRLHAAELEVLIAIKATYMRQLVHAGWRADLGEYSSHIAYKEFSYKQSTFINLPRAEIETGQLKTQPLILVAAQFQSVAQMKARKESHT